MTTCTALSAATKDWKRMPEFDRRIAHGDDWAGDAWLNDKTGNIKLVAVGHEPPSLREEVEELLETFGVELSAGVPQLNRMNKARGYIHHSTEPAALVAMAIAHPVFARDRFPKMKLVNLIVKRPSMDWREIWALALACGVDDIDVFDSAKPFYAHLIDVIERYDFNELFGRDPDTKGNDIRPRGYVWSNSDDDPPAMKAWRQTFKRLPLAKQKMAATILWLYRGAEDKYWFTRMPCGWHAADAIPVIRDAGYLNDWGRLVALYPGW